MTTTISRESLNRTGWICPTCGGDLLRAGGPNAPEIAICVNDGCQTGTLTITEEEGLAMTTRTQQEIINRRRGTCSSCGTPGIHVDTSAGEIVEASEVVADVSGETRLMVSGSGRGIPVLVCDDCEEG